MANPNDVVMPGVINAEPLPETLTENHFPTPPRDGTGYGRSPGEVMTPKQNRKPAFAVTSWSGAKDFPQRREQLHPVPYPFNYDEVEDGGDEDECVGIGDGGDTNGDQYVMPTFTNVKTFMGNPNYDEEDEVEDEDDEEDDDDYEDKEEEEVRSLESRTDEQRKHIYGRSKCVADI